MKKVITILLGAFLSVQVFALPAQVIFDAASGFAMFYTVGTYQASERALDGWYAEIILQSGNAAYVKENFATYSVAGVDFGNYIAGNTYHEVGKYANGTAITTSTADGRAQIKWEFTDTAISSYYATWRVYNNADKKLATKYLVLGWQQLNTTPGDPAPAIKTLFWTTTSPDQRGQMTYDASAVPEPTAMALFGLSGLALVLRRKMRKDA